MEPIELLLWIIGIFAFLLITTFLLKRFAKAQTFYVGSMVRTTRFLPLLDKFAEHKKILNLFADIGLVLGFGAIAIDYLIGRKLGKKMRVIVFVASAIVLFEFFNFFFPILLSNPFTEQYNFFISLGFALMGFAGFLLVALTAYAQFVISSILAGEKACPGVAPLIPGITLPKLQLAVPLHGWISIILILVIHEGMHGVLMRKARMAVKSTGVLLLGLFPIGAFVEPYEEPKELDEETLRKLTKEQLEEALIARKIALQEIEKHIKRTRDTLVSRGPLREQLRVFSAGPMANLAACVIVLVFAFIVLSGIGIISNAWAQEQHKNAVQGIAIESVDANINFCGKIFPSPAFGKLEPGMLVLDVNGKKIESESDWARELSKIGKNSYDLNVDANGIQKIVSLTPNQQLGFHGYTVTAKLKPGYIIPVEYRAYSFSINFLNSFLFWLLLLNLMLGIINFLPMDPFDGGKIAKIFFLPYFGFLKMPKEKTEKIIAKIFFYIVIALLILNALPWVL